MKRLKTFENFKNTMVEQIFTSDYDKEIGNIFKQIQDTYSSNNIKASNDGLGTIEYNIGGTKIEVRDDAFFAIPGYTLKINGKDIDCSFILNKKIYNYLHRKLKEKEKSKILNDISEVGRDSGKYNL